MKQSPGYEDNMEPQSVITKEPTNFTQIGGDVPPSNENSQRPGFINPGCNQETAFNNPGYNQQPGFNNPGYNQQPGFNHPGHIQQPGFNNPGYNQQLGFNNPGHIQQPGFNNPGYIQQPGFNNPGPNQQHGFNNPGYYQQPGFSNPGSISQGPAQAYQPNITQVGLGGQTMVLQTKKYSMVSHIVFSCFVFWCCNLIFGAIAFFYALNGDNKPYEEAKKFGKISNYLNIAGIVVTVFIVAVAVGVSFTV